MVNVSKKAISQIKVELANIQAENESIQDPYIRLYMTYG